MGNSTQVARSFPGANGTSRELRNGRHADEYYKPFPPNYFAPKANHQVLDIGIVGAGIAGLTAAVALVQSGHNVEASRREECFLQFTDKHAADLRKVKVCK